jgi:hypothetical protein
MNTPRRLLKIARLLMCGSLVASLLCLAPTRTAPSAASAADPSSATARTPEVRLRKLHLVRPDLIPYPVCYEVYC